MSNLTGREINQLIQTGRILVALGLVLQSEFYFSDFSVEILGALTSLEVYPELPDNASLADMTLWLHKINRAITKLIQQEAI